MKRKHKYLTLFLTFVLSALLVLSLSSCKAFDGPQGPKGEQGVQGEQGVSGADGATWLVGVEAPAKDRGVDGDFYLNTATFDLYVKSAGAWGLVGNIKGNDAAQTFAVITFDSQSEEGECDPLIVEKGSTVELPVPQKFGYKFGGWYYYGGETTQKITDQTVIENSMALKAKWTSQIVLSQMEQAIANENWYAELYYPLMEGMSEALPLYIQSIEFEGEKYYEEEALEEGIILDELYVEIIDKYDESTDNYYDTGYYYVEGVFGKVGDYVINVASPFGASFGLELTVAPPVFNGTISIDSIVFSEDPLDNCFVSGDTVTFVKGSVPAIDMMINCYAPYGSTYSATLNGVPLTDNSFQSNGSNLYQAYFLGELDETLDTHVFTFTVNSEWYGSKTATLTLKIVEAPAANSVLYHGWTEAVAPDEAESDYFEETLIYYSVDGVTPIATSVVTDADGAIITTVTPSVAVDGNTLSCYNGISISTSDYPVGKYTVTTTLKSDETDQATDVIPVQTATFYVAPYWKEKTSMPMIVGNTVDLVYELDDEITTLEIMGKTIAKGESLKVTTEEADFELSFVVAEGKTTLTVKATAKKMNKYPDKEMLFTTVSTEDYSWELVIYGVEIISERLIRTYAQMFNGAMKYSLETYFADLIAVEGPVKQFYDAINIDYVNADVLEIIPLLENGEMENLYMQAMAVLDVDMEEGQTIEQYLTAAREKVLDECSFSVETIELLDSMVLNLYLFDNEWYDDYSSLFDIGKAEFTYTYQNGRLIADFFYEQMVADMEEDISYMPETLAIMVKNIINARQALMDAEAQGETQTQTLVKEYVSSLEVLLFLMVGGSGPIIRI